MPARSWVGCWTTSHWGDRGRCGCPPATEAIVGWVGSLPGPVAVTYEAGPTGFGLARALAAAGVRCEVVAPSKLERPPGDRVKTDRRDAERLARLLHIGELPGVRVPVGGRGGRRDLVRAREDARADLMRARHRLSKLLLRQGLVFDGCRLDRGARAVAAVAQQFDPAGPAGGRSTRPTRRSWPSRPAATAWTPRSPSWPRRRAGRRWWTGWVACVGSAC